MNWNNNNSIQLFKAIMYLLYLYFSSIGGIIEMNAFQNEFPAIFLKDESNDTDHSCSSGSGESEDLLVVNMIQVHTIYL